MGDAEKSGRAVPSPIFCYRAIYDMDEEWIIAVIEIGESGNLSGAPYKSGVNNFECRYRNAVP